MPPNSVTLELNYLHRKELTEMNPLKSQRNKYQHHVPVMLWKSNVISGTGNWGKVFQDGMLPPVLIS